MKKTILIISLILIVIAPSLGAQSTGTITTTVFVQGSFNLMVSTDSFDFARLMPGQLGEMSRGEGVVVASTSTGDDPWYIKVSSKGPLSSGDNEISDDNFSWFGTTEGTGSFYAAKEKNFSDPNGTAYMSSYDEITQAAKVLNKFKFRLKVPEDTKAGNYTTTVMFTMTE
jgi:hypothetical protein